MRTMLLLVAVVAVATLADGQTNAARIAAQTVVDGGRVTNVPVQGSSQRRIETEQIVILRGDVTVTTDAAVIHADEAVYHRDMNRVELRGNVSIQLAALPVISK